MPDLAMNNGNIRMALSDATTVNWAEFHPVAALCLPAIAILLGAGLILGWPQAALAATSGALIAGFGFFQQVSNRRGSIMLLVVAGMSLSAAIGTLVNVSWPLETGCIALWGFAMGLATLVSLPLAWVVMQCAIALIVSAAIPAGLTDAVYRALLIGAGGVLQTILMEVVVFRFPRLEEVVNRPGAEVGALLTVCVTGYIALLFAYAGLPEPAVTLHRLEATALGGALALVIHHVVLWLWRRFIGPDQNGDAGPLVIAATSPRQASAPSAAATKPSA